MRIDFRLIDRKVPLLHAMNHRHRGGVDTLPHGILACPFHCTLSSDHIALSVELRIKMYSDDTFYE